MTNDEAIYTLKNTAWLGWDKQKEKVTEAVRMAVEALKTQLPKEDTTSDCISRQDVIHIVDGIDTWQAGWRGDAIESIKALPSAQPEDCSTCKHGHFSDRQCDYCGVRYPSHYERDENE